MNIQVCTKVIDVDSAKFLYHNQNTLTFQ